LEDLPFEVFSAVRRPELVDKLIGVNPDITNAEVLKVYAPGDCLLRVIVNTSAKVSVFALMTLAETTPFMGTDFPLLLRTFRRSEFPLPNCFTVFSATLMGGYNGAPLIPHPRGLLATRTANGRASMCDVVELCPTTGKARVHSFIFLPTAHKWMMPMMAKHLNSTCQRQLNLSLESIPPALMASPFVVLRIKKCSRGPPLMILSPAEASQLVKGDTMYFNEEYWKQGAPHGEFGFALYLQTLLVQLGLSQFVEDVYDSMDGRQLVFFQAALRTCIWPQIEATITHFFNKHASAYRHWYGGRAAPNLQVTGANPIFVDQSPVSPRCSALDFHADTYFPDFQKLQHKNTFIHFEEAPWVG